jgi:hypothetical protein
VGSVVAVAGRGELSSGRNDEKPMGGVVDQQFDAAAGNERPK